MMQQACRKPLYDYRKEIEDALNTLERLFGVNSFHEHQKIIGYLQGWLAAYDFVERYHDNGN